MAYESNYLAHYGIAGQKWGIRRFQNEDGSLTDEGKLRYLKQMSDKEQRIYNKMSDGHKRYIEKQLDEGKNFATASRNLQARQGRIVGLATAAIAATTIAGSVYLAKNAKALKTNIQFASSIFKAHRTFYCKFFALYRSSA